MAQTEPTPPENSDVSAGPWSTVFWLAIPHGVLVGVRLPEAIEAPPPWVLQRLHPKERAACLERTGRRQMEFAGGRLALQLGIKRLRTRRLPFLAQQSGCIQQPRGLSASVSHKRDLAIGLVGQRSAGSLGVDLECLEPARSHLAPRILTPRELERWEALAPDRRWPALLCSFSLKESFYKAVYPYVERYVGFQEASVEIDPNGGAQILPELEGGEGPFSIQGHYRWQGQHLITSVRLSPV